MNDLGGLIQSTPLPARQVALVTARTAGSLTEP